MRKGWKWFWRVVGVGVVLVVVAAGVVGGVAWTWRRIPVGKETTRISGPLAGDGLPDYLGAINQRHGAGVTVENNAAPVLLAVVGTGDHPAAWVATERRLLEMDTVDAPELERFSEWLVKQGKLKAEGGYVSPRDMSDQDERVGGHTSKAWRRADDPDVAAYLDDEAGALAAVEKAAGRERFYLPMVTPEGDAATVVRPSLVMDSVLNARAVVHAVAARAALRLGEGDTAGYLRDVRTVSGLRGLLSSAPDVIGYLQALAVAAMEAQAMQVGACSPNLDRAAAEELERAAAGVTFPTAADAIDEGDRYFFLDEMCYASKTIPRYVPMNFRGAMAEGNALYDRYRDAFGAATFADRKALIDAANADVSALGGSALRPADKLVATLIPGYDETNVLYTDWQANARLARVAAALRVYRLKEGGFPEKLEALGLPAEAVRDPWVERPLVYRREGEGFVVYSCGRNQRDDGGNPRRGPTGDVVVRAER